MAKKLTTQEKFIKAKSEYEAKKYTSIEAASVANKLSPASYYNYAKKLNNSPAALTTSPENMSEATIKEALGPDVNPTIASLQKHIERLEKKIVDLVMAKV